MKFKAETETQTELMLLMLFAYQNRRLLKGPTIYSKIIRAIIDGKTSCFYNTNPNNICRDEELTHAHNMAKILVPMGFEMVPLHEEGAKVDSLNPSGGYLIRWED